MQRTWGSARKICRSGKASLEKQTASISGSRDLTRAAGKIPSAERLRPRQQHGDHKAIHVHCEAAYQSPPGMIPRHATSHPGPKRQQHLRAAILAASHSPQYPATVTQGILFSIIGSTLFAVLYYYATLLTPLDGEQIFGWRTLLTFPFLTAFIWWSRQQHMVLTLAARMKAQPLFFCGALLTSALLGIQLWLFMWAPLHGRALNVSLGYFLLPLTMLLTGRLLYRERLTRWQNLAALAATIGVANEFYHVGVLSWETLVVALGYPVYFVLRRKMDAANLGGLWFDMALLLPAGLWFIMTGTVGFDMIADHRALYALIPLLGILSSIALVFYILASQMLSLSLFGLLGYVEPVLLVVVALLLGESISGAQWMTYIPVWCAVGLLVVEGTLSLKRRQVGKTK